MTTAVQVVSETVPPSHEPTPAELDNDCVGDLLGAFQLTEEPTDEGTTSSGPTIEQSPQGTISRLHGASTRIPAHAFLPEGLTSGIDVAPSGESLAWALLETWPCLLDPTGDGLPELYMTSEEIRGDKRIVQFKQEWAGLEVFGSSLTLFFSLDGGFIGLQSRLLPQTEIQAWESELESAASLEDLPAVIEDTDIPGLYSAYLLQGDLEDDRLEIAFRGTEHISFPQELVYRSAVDGTTLFSLEIPSGDKSLSIGDASCQGAMNNFTWEWSHEPSCSGIDPWYQDLCDASSITYDYMAQLYARDSWNDGNTCPHCTGASVSDMAAVGRVGDGGDCACCYAGVTTTPNYDYCLVIISNLRTCLDVVAHEFFTLADWSEADLSHSSSMITAEAIMEGLADGFGELVEEWHSGTADWAHGTDTPLGTCTQTRRLDSPGSSQVYIAPYFDCTSIQAMSLPDHVSNFNSAPALGIDQQYFNSTIAGKTAHLMARAETAPAVTHWGLDVEGAGIDCTRSSLYHALTLGLPQDSNYTDLRTALLDAALAKCTIPQYRAVEEAVNAMGYWEPPTQFPRATAHSPAAVSYGGARYYFFNQSDDLYFMKRICPYYSTSCSWDTPVYLGGLDLGVAAVSFGDAVFIFSKTSPSSSAIQYWKLGTGGFTGPYSITKTQTDRTPSAVVIGGVLYVFYRESASSALSEYKVVKLSDPNSMTWSMLGTGVQGYSAPRAVVSSGYQYLVFSDDNDYVRYHYSTAGGTMWSGPVSPGGLCPQTNDWGEAPGAAFFLGRLHLSYPGVHCGPTETTIYASSPSPFQGTSTWTRTTNVDWRDVYSDWVFLESDGTGDVNALYQFRSRLGPRDRLRRDYWRRKFSE